jgi:subtilisin family serine protease
MGIGSVDALGIYSSFSSHGPSADGRVKPDAAAQGSSAYIADPYSGFFTYGSGTSFSSPILAGMAACLWQANPSQTNMEIADAIRHSGSQYLSPDDELGYGIPDFVEANNILTIIDGPEAGNLSLEVYPNPFTDEIRLNLAGTEIRGTVRVIVSDITGKRVVSDDRYLSGGTIEITVTDLERLNPGIYLISVQSETVTAKAMAVKR